MDLRCRLPSTQRTSEEPPSDSKRDDALGHLSSGSTSPSQKGCLKDTFPRLGLPYFKPRLEIGLCCAPCDPALESALKGLHRAMIVCHSTELSVSPSFQGFALQPLSLPATDELLALCKRVLPASFSSILPLRPPTQPRLALGRSALAFNDTGPGVLSSTICVDPGSEAFNQE